MATLPSFPPAPPVPPVDSAEPAFTNPTWQRWFAGLSTGLKQLQAYVGSMASDLAALAAVVAGKQAALGYTPVNKAGDSMSGRLTVAATDWPLILQNTGAGTMAILQGNGPNGNKHLRIIGGTLDIVNSAFSQSICALTDDGHLSAVYVAQTSDETLKHKWKGVEKGFLKQLAGLKRKGLAGSFSWRKSGQRALGLGAQSIEQFCPLAVHTDAAGLKSVLYGAFASVAAVELACELELQQEQMDALREENRLLKKRMDALERLVARGKA